MCVCERMCFYKNTMGPWLSHKNKGSIHVYKQKLSSCQMSTMHLFQMKPLANTFNAEDTKRYFIGDNCDCTKLEIAGTLCPRSILVSHWISQTRFFSTSFPCRSWPALDLGELKP